VLRSPLCPGEARCQEVYPDLLRRLRTSRNPDGGWAYYTGKSSRLEPTVWAALALALDGETEPLERLRNWPSRNGLLLERADGDPNYGFHGLALIALQLSHAALRDEIRGLVEGIRHVKGVRLEIAEPQSRQDYTLQGWSWFPETFSWVEPTAWCMLSLKKWARRRDLRIDAARLDEAERLLVNRSCRVGGWNYGNADVLGRDLYPYVPTTAIALLALQDRRTLDVVHRGLEYLAGHATAERSAQALALAAIALNIYGRDTTAVRTALLAQLPTTIALGNQVAIALAAYALGPNQSDGAFTL
jgi:hypothetical protein